MDNKEILKKTMLAANNKYFNGEREYWPFLEEYMTDYYHSERIAEIVDIEKEFDEHPSYAKIDYIAKREELHRLTLKCLDEALCNFINSRWPGAVQITPKE